MERYIAAGPVLSDFFEHESLQNLPVSAIQTSMGDSRGTQSASVSLALIGRAWAPLAVSWLFMAIELLIVSALIARLAHPEINLAAFGGVIFPLALVIEAPILMILAASTALCRDWSSYRLVLRYTVGICIGLTTLHVLLVFTPAYDFVVVRLMRAPEEIVDSARLGLILLIPWAWAIGYRRFLQGILIRFGLSNAIGIGTAARVAALTLFMIAGGHFELAQGAVLASAALSLGVLAEAAYIYYRARPVLRHQLAAAPPMAMPITSRGFIGFYTPLALTSICFLGVHPLATAAIGRMPNALESLAVWPALTSLLFIARSTGMAYNEVVVALADREGAYAQLRRFAGLLAIGLTVPLVLIAATPLSSLWFGVVVGLKGPLILLAGQALLAGLFLPSLSVYQSLYQGVLVTFRRTRAITESTVLFLGATVAVLAGGVWWGALPGALVGLLALTAGHSVQNLWQRHRAGPMLRSLDPGARPRPDRGQPQIGVSP